VRSLPRIAVGMAVFAGGLTLLVYGIAQAVEIGSCGTDEYGRSIGPPCPDGFGPMIALMVLGAFAALGGAMLSARGPVGIAALGGMVRFFAAGIVAGGAGAVLALIDLHDADSRPGLEVVAVVVVPVLAFSLPGLARGKPRAAPAVAAPEPAVAAPGPAVAAARASTSADEVASRLRQLEQLRQSGLLGDDEYKARRAQILGDL